MDKLPNIPWWTSMGFQHPEPAPDTDYADMGTAFGLDASMKSDQDPDTPAIGSDAGPGIDRLNRRSVI